MHDDGMSMAERRQVTADWAARFPRLSAWKPMWLVRRHGPLIHGLCLDDSRGCGFYIPQVFIHCLAEPAPAVALDGALPVRTRAGHPTRITLADHGARIVEVGGRLAHQCAALASGALSLADLADHLSASAAMAHEAPDGRRLRMRAVFALSAALIGDARQAQCAIDQTRAATEERASGMAQAAWARDLRTRLADVPGLSRCVAREVARHGLGRLSDAGLLGGEACQRLG